MRRHKREIKKEKKKDLNREREKGKKERERILTTANSSEMALSPGDPNSYSRPDLVRFCFYTLSSILYTCMYKINKKVPDTLCFLMNKKSHFPGDDQAPALGLVC